MLAAGAAAIAALAGSTVTAAAASAHTANWNIPWKDIHYSFNPCKTHMSPYEPQYGGMICQGYYRVNHRNYKFTEDDTNACPAIGTLEYYSEPVIRATLYAIAATEEISRHAAEDT